MSEGNVKQLVDADQFRRTVARIAHEIVEAHADPTEIMLAGIHTRGVPLAARLVDHIERFTGTRPPLGTLDIGLYRDDDAVPLRQARLERLDPVAQPMAYEQVASAITSLGGALSATQTEAAESAQYHLHRAAMGPDATPAPAPRGGTGGAAARQKKKAARQMKKKTRPKKKK